MLHEVMLVCVCLMLSYAGCLKETGTCINEVFAEVRI